MEIKLSSGCKVRFEYIRRVFRFGIILSESEIDVPLSSKDRRKICAALMSKERHKTVRAKRLMQQRKDNTVNNCGNCAGNRCFGCGPKLSRWKPRMVSPVV